MNSAPPVPGELYRSENLSVRIIPGRDPERWFITFDPVGQDHRLDRPGFGEAYFQSRGISVVSIVGRGSHWYQYSDMALALGMVRHALRAARARITYGSSMGGYAAIRFADAVGATACLALSPQYSIDPRKASFDRRWRPEANAIRWLSELDGPIRCRAVPVVLYDNHDLDAEHVRRIARDTRIAPIAIPYAGHPTGTYLVSSGLLAPLLDAIHDDALDPAMFQTIARERRKTSAAWIGELARRQPPHRNRLGVRLARRALEVLPDNDLLLYILAQRLASAGCSAEALEMHHAAFELSGRQGVYGLPYSQALYDAGDVQAALDVAVDLQYRFPQLIHLSKWLAELHLRMGNLEREIERTTALLARAPSDAGCREQLANYRKHLKNGRAARYPPPLREARRWLRRTVSDLIRPGMTGLF